MGRHGPPDPETRFWRQVKLMPDGCLVWTGANQPNGTGQFGAGSMTSTAHRWAWSFQHGSMPENGTVLAHGCGNAWCVNVEHLVETTRQELARNGEKKFRRVHD